MYENVGRVRRVLRPRPLRRCASPWRSCRPTSSTRGSGGRASSKSFEQPLRVDDVLAEHDDGVHHERGLPRTLLGWLTTTDHKAIGVAYIVTAFVFLLIGGALAGMIRAELAEPGLQFVERADLQRAVHDARQRHVVPVRRAVRVRASPTTSCRCRSARRTWPSRASTRCPTGCTCSAALIDAVGFLTDGGAATFGWTAYPPLSGATGSPGTRRRPVDRGGGPHRHVGHRSARSTSSPRSTTMRAPGMTMFRMPIFTWNMLVTSSWCCSRSRC